jgi:hypothetical protein
VEAMREKWTDERLDDMNHRIDEGFNRLDRDVGDLRAEMNSRFEATQRLIIQVGGGMFVTMVVGFLGVITHL